MMYLLRASAHAGMPLPLDRRPRGVVELHVAVKMCQLISNVKKRGAKADQAEAAGLRRTMQREETAPGI